MKNWPSLQKSYSEPELLRKAPKCGYHRLSGLAIGNKLGKGAQNSMERSLVDLLGLPSVCGAWSRSADHSSPLSFISSITIHFLCNIHFSP